MCLQIGLVEVYGLLAYMNSSTLYHSDHPRGNGTSHLRLSLKKPRSVVAFKRCAHKMILPAQDLAFYQYVLLTGACQDEGRLFVARIWSKTSKFGTQHTGYLPTVSVYYYCYYIVFYQKTFLRNITYLFILPICCAYLYTYN